MELLTKKNVHVLDIIMSLDIIIYTLRKRREIKTVSVFPRLLSCQVPWCSLSWLKWLMQRKYFLCRLLEWLYAKIRRPKIPAVQRKGLLMGNTRMIFRTSKGGIGRCKLTKLEERVFGGNCKGGCMHNQGCKNKEVPTISQRIQHSLYWRQSCC